MFNNGILPNRVLIPKLLNKPFTSCSYTNLDFLIPQTGHFDCLINLLFFVLTIFSICSTLDAINFHLIFITSVCKTLNYFLLLCFCFKNLDLFDQQKTQFDFSQSTLFVIFTSCDLKLCVKSLHPKQYVIPGLFPIFIGFISDCVFFIFCNLVKCFWHIVSILLIFSLQLIFQNLQQLD